MHPAISYELAKARIADLRHQAQRDAVISRQAIAEVPMTGISPRQGTGQASSGLGSAPRSHGDNHNP